MNRRGKLLFSLSLSQERRGGQGKGGEEREDERREEENVCVRVKV